MSLFAGIFIFDLIASTLTFVLYGWDKAASKRRSRRIPENILHFVALLGGWPGASLAQALLRHKTKKRSFLNVFWITAVANVVATTLVVRLRA